MQTLNRINYEEYFLLYADDELDAATKILVENFVEQNPDLSTEFEMILLAKCTPENIFFNDKESLLRTEGNTINETNYEEYFLLYLDKELTAAKRAEVEMYVLQHPKLQDEFTGLKQAVLIPEPIAFNDKQSLYRTEKRRTIYLTPWRFVAAAIFIGFCAIGFWLWQKQQPVVRVAVNKASINHSHQNISAIKPADSVSKIQQTKQPAEVTAQQISAPKITDAVKPVTRKKYPVKNAEEPVVAVTHPSKQNENISLKKVDENDILHQTNTLPAEHNDVAVELPSTNKKDIGNTKNQPETNNENTGDSYKVYNVAYKEINPDNDDNSLHVGALDLNKTKVKNLLRQAGKFFGKKQTGTTSENGKLQVANFEIETIKQ